MKLLDIFQGFSMVKSYSAVHFAFLIIIWRLTGSWKDDIKPEPNPDFVNLLNWF